MMQTKTPPRTWLRLAPALRPLALVLAVALGAATLAACDSGSSETETPGESFDRVAMLDHYGANIIVPAYEDLDAATGTLRAATQAFADAPSAATLASARNALRGARLAWQDASLFQFGPAESMALRSALNTYPADMDRIEANVAAARYDDLGSLSNQAARGFPAMGYLLYDAGLGAGATDAEIVAAYAEAPAHGAYLAANATFVHDKAQAVVEAWAPTGGDYLAMFASEANAGTDVGSSVGMLINAFVKHYERFLRDGKIGIPAGVRSAGVPRPTSTEARYGGYSAQLALNNLLALQQLYEGEGATSNGPGLGSYLRALGAGDLDAEIETAFDEAASAVADLDDPLAQQIETNNDPVLAAFQEMQDLVVLLKADMTSILGVTITFADNDGD